MARNRGKRPGTSSGPKFPNSDQVRKAGQVTSDSAAKPAENLISHTAAIDGKPTSDGATTSSISARTATAGASSAAANKVKSSITTDSKPAAGAGSVPSSKAGGGIKMQVAAAAASTSSAGDGGSRGSGGFWPGMLGGLIGGGAIALAASVFLIGGNDGEALIQLQSATADLDSRLSTTESQVEAVGSLADRVAAVEETPALSVAGADGGGRDLADRLNDLEQKLASFSAVEGSMSSADDNIAVEERIAALEQQFSELSDTATSTSEAQQLTSDAMIVLQSALPALEATLSAAGQQTAMLGGSVDTFQQATEHLGVDLEALSDRVGQTESKLDYIGGMYQRAAAMVVAIGDVDRSISKAEPFEMALESLRALGKDDPSVNEAVTTLEPMAAQGVLTLTALKASFGEVGSRILLAEDGDGTFADQISDNFFGIINMRPAGAVVEGDDSRAIVARTQAKLSADDLEGSIAELSGLNGVALKSAGGWVASAKARLAADAAIADLRAHAQSLLATGS